MKKMKNKLKKMTNRLKKREMRNNKVTKNKQDYKCVGLEQ